MPYRERYLFVCTNRRPTGTPRARAPRRAPKSSSSRLKEALARRGVAKECGRAPRAASTSARSGISVVQEPEHVAYGNVTVDDVDAIADAAARGEVVERARRSRAARGR